MVLTELSRRAAGWQSVGQVVCGCRVGWGGWGGGLGVVAVMLVNACI